MLKQRMFQYQNGRGEGVSIHINAENKISDFYLEGRIAVGQLEEWLRDLRVNQLKLDNIGWAEDE